MNNFVERRTQSRFLVSRETDFFFISDSQKNWDNPWPWPSKQGEEYGPGKVYSRERRKVLGIPITGWSPANLVE